LLSGRSILVVDAAPQTTSLLAELFTAQGADVAVADTGVAAMIRIQLGSYDLVVLDLEMPSPSGRDVLEFMHRINPDLLRRTLLLASGRSAEAIGIPTVTKPLEPEAVRSAACRMLSAPSAR
jgi:CheY-like chemotaxis protein